MEGSYVQETSIQQDTTDSLAVMVGFVFLALMLGSSIAFIFILGPKLHSSDCTSHSTSKECDNYQNQLKQHQSR
jgi:hypothetical protein